LELALSSVEGSFCSPVKLNSVVAVPLYERTAPNTS
jgi:hypothetical protein